MCAASKCNSVLGYVNDSPDILRKLAEYLEKRSYDLSLNGQTDSWEEELCLM